VFLSFAHNDEAVGLAIRTLLNTELNLDEDSVFMWSEQAQPRAGRDWMDEIRNALDVVKVYVAVFSAVGLHRPWVNFEAGAAWLRRIPMIPCCLGQVDKGNLPPPYSRFHAVNLISEAYPLVTAVARELRKPKPIGQMFYTLKKTRREAEG
jgi:hypothetical protein